VSGNLTYDPNKKLTFQYNHLNLPYKIIGAENDELHLSYAADGTLLQRKYLINNIVRHKVDYIGDKEYHNDTIEYIHHNDGRMIKQGNVYEYEYNIKDHLGNVRVTFADKDNNNEITTTDRRSINDYYSFGMQHYNAASKNEYATSKNNYKYNGKEEFEEMNLGLYMYGWRYMDPVLGRFTSVDPSSSKNNFESPYVYVHNNPLKYIDPDGRDAILVVFPDYKISTPVGKVGNLGHAGVLLIDNKTGMTKYYEYGRYDSEGIGLVRNVSVSNVKIGKDGKPTEKSLQKVLAQISKKSGQKGRIEGAYIESDNFEAMNNYAKEKMAENSDPNRDPYSLTSNNCGTFGCDVVNQDPNVAKNSPSVVDPRPNSIIGEYQGEFGKVQYNPKTGGTVETIDKSRYKEFLDKLKSQFNP
jgi:RHS repeat-associated protein